MIFIGHMGDFVLKQALVMLYGPPYYYKVAYDEAVAMLERLKV